MGLQRSAPGQRKIPHDVPHATQSAALPEGDPDQQHGQTASKGQKFVGLNNLCLVINYYHLETQRADTIGSSFIFEF